MNTYNDFIAQNIAPYAAKKIGVYNGSGTKVGEVPLGDFKPAYGNRLYRFGLLSDVHNQNGQADENTEDFQRALEFFNQTESVSMTCICGDISQNGLESELQLYKNNINSKSPNTPVHTCAGNHDAKNNGSSINIANWETYTGHTWTFEITKNNDHFLFLSLDTWNNYRAEDIDWLEDKLEQYRNQRCFVIMHYFVPDYAGNFKSIYPSGNWLSGEQLTRIRGLVGHYKNSIWFSGHSHWKWYLQKYESKANIYKNNSAWTVHVPSCASPIDSDGISTRVTCPFESEGAIVDVYENYIDIRGMDLKNLKYLPIAQYRLDTTIVNIPAKTVVYSITNTLTNCSNSNSATSISKGSSYNATITANIGYNMSSISVTMGGTNITSSAVSGNNIYIGNVTGNIIITTNATEKVSTTNNIALTWSANTRIDTSTGAESINPKYYASNYIPVNSNNVYTISTNLASGDVEGKICYYDAQQSFLSCGNALINASGTLPSSAVIDIPSNTSYIRIRAFNQSQNDTFANSINLTETSYI